MTNRFDDAVTRLSSALARIARRLSVGAGPGATLAALGLLFAVAAALYASGAIATRSRWLPYIAGTSVEREAEFLNRPGYPGFEYLDLLVEPLGTEDASGAHFLARARALERALRSVDGAREVASILPSLGRIAEASYGKPFPESDEEAHAAMFLLEASLAPAVARELWYSGGIRLSVSYATDDSVELGRFCDDVTRLAEREFGDLRVSPFAKVPLASRVDRYVREGKLANVFTSQAGVALLAALAIALRARASAPWRLSAWRGGLAVSLPLFLATAVLALVMAALGIPLDVATASIGALTINAATDFGLYLTMAFQSELARGSSPPDALSEALDRQAKIILLDFLLNSICFLPLFSSHFAPVRDVGWMMTVMLATSAAGAIFCLAPILPRSAVPSSGRAR